jgi:hypothetical protein
VLQAPKQHKNVNKQAGLFFATFSRDESERFGREIGSRPKQKAKKRCAGGHHEHRA